MRYRFYGDELQLVQYVITVPANEYQSEMELTAVTEEERDGFLEAYPTAEYTEIDNSGYEWLNGTVWTSQQFQNGELEAAIEMGQAAYEEMKDASNQDKINAMFMLEIAQLKAGVGNE